jgi:CheY-like chemotaxis protein
MQILLVSNQPSEVPALIAAFSLRRVAARVHLLESVDEALAHIRERALDEGRPHLVILDLEPVAEVAIELLRRIKSQPGTRAVPVVLLGRTTAAMAEAYRLGANSCVVKPTDPARFAEGMGGLAWYWTRLNEPPVRWESERAWEPLPATKTPSAD